MTQRVKQAIGLVGTLGLALAISSPVLAQVQTGNTLNTNDLGVDVVGSWSNSAVAMFARRPLVSSTWPSVSLALSPWSLFSSEGSSTWSQAEQKTRPLKPANLSFPASSVWPSSFPHGQSPAS